MKFKIDVVCVDDDGTEQPREIMALSRAHLAMDTLGLTLAESKELLHHLQIHLVEQQAAAYLRQHHACPQCGQRYASKGQGRSPINTLFGPVAVPNPRWYRCPCTPTNGPRTFRLAAQWLGGRSSPELLYVESKWSSLVPYAKVVELLTDVLPVAQTLRAETVRRHVHATARRLEQALGEERECLFEGSEEDWADQPIPDGPMTVGIDGGMVRARHKAGCFEVIAGKSIVAFRRSEGANIPSAKRFAFVQSYDTKPRRRLWELMKSQGMQENQEVLFLSDGGDTVRNLQAYLHPSSEHVLDWFHVTMRITVMRQQNKAIIEEDTSLGTKAQDMLERVKHFLWHGNVDAALERVDGLLCELDLRGSHSPAIAKLSRSITEFATYVRNNRNFIPNFGERYRQGDTISTAFVESTINQVVSKRFVKKQQMQWTPKGAHLLLQTRTRVLSDDLAAAFREWYPRFQQEAA